MQRRARAAVYRIGVLRLLGYREWTEGLGDDREWIIQVVQSGIYGLVSAEGAAIGAHAMPLRYDYMILLDSGAYPDGLRKISSAASSVAPTPVSISAACAPTPMDAQRIASADPGIYEGCASDPIAAVHMDMDDISSRTQRESAYATFEEVLGIVHAATKEASSLGGLVQYLGGDNLMAFLPRDSLDEFLKFVRGLEGVKAGVGVHRIPREAIALAARDLRSIRASRSRG
ncbi:GTP cyclohydrolase IIa [Conexivisphaera calida]|uniref:GTP cyclohydrolase IIa n=1 Tax=Conexivisphaera calida TaxID=1874277 RepID=UPI00157BB12A|nr:GTP cyclohydrolase IIa [Conexivisphaera calida]